MPCGAPDPGGTRDAKPHGALHCRLLFPKTSRLLRHALFQKTFDAGGEGVGRGIILWVRRGEDCACRMGVVATKRTFHDAVQRNRAKRLIRETFRLTRPDLLDEPWDMVVLARRRILEMKQPEVRKEFLRLCRRQGVAKPQGEA